MELWFTEKSNDSVGLTLLIKEHLYHKESKYQTIDVLESAYYGKVLVIDKVVMLTERDEFVYHELLTHVPLQYMENPLSVLIIGGGDGGTAREVLKYRSVNRVVLVEIDKEVIETSKKFFPTLSFSFDDKRLEVMIEDGAKFVKETDEKFDLIIVDSTDPVGPGEVLFSSEFYKDCSSILKDSGVLTAQTESPFDLVYRPVIQNIYENLKTGFKTVRMYLGSIPTYPFGLWSFAFASNGVDPLKEELKNPFIPDGLKYYNRELGRCVFNLPNFVKEIIDEA